MDHAQAGGPPQTTPHLRVVLVDDNAPFRAALRRTLHSRGAVDVGGEAGAWEGGALG